MAVNAKINRLLSPLVEGGKGFSLVEMLVALLILSVSILALTSLTITGIKANAKNELRNVAVRITKETMEDILAGPFTGLSDASTTRSVSVRGISQSFDIDWTVTETSANLKEVFITVETEYAGETISNFGVVYKHASS